MKFKEKKTVDDVNNFIRKSLKKSGMKKLIVAVSGGLDSAVSLSLACKAVGGKNVIPVLLPYKEQSVDDSRLICEWNGFVKNEIVEINIGSMVDAIDESLKIGGNLRPGNVMARMRMIVIYDLAKKEKALVCGTENKSEKYLGYFTRFGDEASDIEPIQHLYKTEVRQLAKYLEIPVQLIEKAPSAGLWEGQSDENELGFEYEEADFILEQFVDFGKSKSEIIIEGVNNEIVEMVINRVESVRFKLEVPYHL